MFSIILILPFVNHRITNAKSIRFRRMKGVSMERERVILHSDLNCFYASVEMNEKPSLKGKAVAVCGDSENRHGIVLAKSYQAKAMGVITGQPNWEALRSCPNLIIVPPHYDLYLRYSRDVRKIYHRFSENVEPFGMDECWIDLGYLKNGFQKGHQIAERIKELIQNEIGITASIGVSFTKTFAKLGSDMKKPNAVTLITRENFKQKVWPLPVSELLYVGPATTRKLDLMNIHTIGDLANTNVEWIRRNLGKNGLMLHTFATGSDCARVMPYGFVSPIKSFGHGATCIADLENNNQVWNAFLELSQDLGRRLRENELAAQSIQIVIKNCELSCKQYQIPLPYTTQSPIELAQCAYLLFRTRYDWDKPVRALTIRAIALESEHDIQQLDILQNYQLRDKQKALEDVIYTIRNRFGKNSIQSATLVGNSQIPNDHCDSVKMPGLMYL